MKKLFAILAMTVALAGCHIIDTGKVGLRKNFDKSVEKTELVTGSFNQVLIGTVTDFPVREIPLEIKDMHPPALNGDPMGDFDVTVSYNINPSAVSDLYVNKSHENHATNGDGETLLMYTRLQTIVRSAVYKVVNEYESLTMNNHRDAIETKIAEQVRKTLVSEKLEGSIIIGQVQVKSIEPPESVKQSAIRLVAAKAENAAKDIEVSTAEKEAKRIAALNANKGAIEYMNAQSLALIADGVANGKVNTIVVPYDFKGIVNVK